jgi:hypothetical protein
VRRRRLTLRRALFLAHRLIERPRGRQVLASVAAFLLRRTHGRAFRAHLDGHRATQAQQLREVGLVRAGLLLEEREVAEVAAWLGPHECRDPYRPRLQPFRANAPPRGANLGQYPQSVTVEAPHLLRLANHPQILAVVEDFLGAKPTLSDLRLWWSYPGKTARESQLFHRDVDDLRFCKLFVYLTDVDMHSGAHVFVKDSPRINRCTALRRFSDEEVLRAFGREAITPVCGQRGQGFLVNTAGVHKGLVPTVAPRLIFMAEYSLFPLLSLAYHPITTPAMAGHDRYVNRLLLRAAQGT